METPSTPENELELKLEKLRLEIDEMKRNGRWNRRFGRFVPVFSALIPVLALLFAVQQFKQQQVATTAALDRQTKSDALAAQRAFMQPVIARQMNTYFEASAAAATLASSQNTDERTKARDEFFRLYWGPLVMLESPQVSGAMNAFKVCLDEENGCDAADFQKRALYLSSWLQTDLFQSWKLSPESYAERSINYARDREKLNMGDVTSRHPKPATLTPNTPPGHGVKKGPKHVSGGTPPKGPADPVKVPDPKVPDPKVPDPKVPNPKVTDPKVPDPKVPHG